MESSRKLSYLESTLSLKCKTLFGELQFLRKVERSISCRNYAWQTQDFPTIWKTALIIPIQKPGKIASDPKSYRPKSLTSCICKTFERMVNHRLVWCIERNQIFTAFQSGFRKQRSTTDHLVRLESFIRESFILNQHGISVFFLFGNSI